LSSIFSLLSDFIIPTDVFLLLGDLSSLLALLPLLLERDLELDEYFE